MYEGLRDNIVFLYGMFDYSRSIGYDVAVVGEAFDDDLYAHIIGSVKEKGIEYNGLYVYVFGSFSSTEWFEKMNWYMQGVDEDVILEAIIGEEEKR